jgi:ribosomal protein S20
MFVKGQSGNPKGRKPKEISSQKLRNLISESDVSDILKTMVEQAKQGDIQAAKLILDKVLPSLKSVDTTIDATVNADLIAQRTHDYRMQFDTAIDEITAAKVYADFIKDC